jgi:hypothetical protein
MAGDPLSGRPVYQGRFVLQSPPAEAPAARVSASVSVGRRLRCPDAFAIPTPRADPG